MLKRLAGIIVLMCLTAATPTATASDTVEICHFPGHIDPANLLQPDFILDLELPPAERAAECTDLNGSVLRVNANSVSYISDDVTRGHEVDG